MKKIKTVLIAGLVAVQLTSVQAAPDSFYINPSASTSSPRISPLSGPETGEKAKALLAAIGPGGKDLTIFTTLARHPDLLEKWLPFAEQVLRASTLPVRDREIVVLRMGWLSQSAYEFAHHVAIGKQVGLSDADIRRVTDGPGAAGLSALDALLLRAVDELNSDSIISDATWKTLADTYSDQQMIDLVFLAGHYKMVSMMLNSLGVQVEVDYVDFLKKP